MTIRHVIAWGIATTVLLATPAAALQTASVAAPTYTFETGDPACRVARLVSTGAPMPANAQTLALRWAGYANYELAYNGRVVLLDAAFDRGSLFPPLGFSVSDVARADAILIGHGHADHMSDAAAVTIRTRALVVGAPLTTAKLATQAVPAAQIRTVTGRGGEVIELPGMRIEVILGRHSVRDTSVTEPFEKVLQAVTPPLTPAQREEQRTIGQRGVSDPRLATEGSLTYLITLDDGFTVLFRDTAGEVTEFERAAMTRVGRVDVAIVALANAYLNPLQAKSALDYVRVYKPGIFIPAHHDAPRNDLWRSTEPIFQVLKDETPSLVRISRSYREPICINTARGMGSTR
jgi:L-ascorbate metabolism protein UlaG (beta-lactamase superfamily)